MVGIVVTVTGAIIHDKLQSREPHLVYRSAETIPFNGPNSVLAIYQLTIANDGTQPADDVTCYVRVGGAKIDQYKIAAAPSLNVSEKLSGESLTVQVPNLNPSEAVQVSLLATGASTSTLPVKPEVSLRGRGAVGEPASETKAEGRTIWPSALSSAFAAIAVMLGSFPLVGRLQTQIRKHIGRQHQVVAGLLRAHGFEKEADECMQRRGTSYRAEADRLGHEIVGTDDIGRRTAFMQVLSSLVGVDMIPESKGIVYYNLARAAATTGETDQARRWLAKANEGLPDEVDVRAKFDPLLNRLGVKRAAVGTDS